jgi:O-antigen/teichoic acid export membrane protein
MNSDFIFAFIDDHVIVMLALFCAVIHASTIQSLENATFSSTDAFSPLEYAYFWWALGAVGVAGAAYQSKTDLLALVGILVVAVIYGLAIYRTCVRNRERWKR